MHSEERTEEATALVVAKVVPLVRTGGNPAADLVAANGQECLHAVSIIEGMRPIADQLLLVGPQGRDPIGVVPIQGPRELQKLLAFLPGDRPFDDEVRHRIISPVPRFGQSPSAAWGTSLCYRPGFALQTLLTGRKTDQSPRRPMGGIILLAPTSQGQPGFPARRGFGCFPAAGM